MSLFLTLLPTLLKFVGWILDKNNASEETKKKMYELIASTADDGLISVQAKDAFKAQKEKILKDNQQ